GALARRTVPDENIEHCLPSVLRRYLRHGATEFEHRIATVGFLEFRGVDRLLANDGPDAVAAALDEVVSVVAEACEAEGIAFLASHIDHERGNIIVIGGAPRERDA